MLFILCVKTQLFAISRAGTVLYPPVALVSWLTTPGVGWAAEPLLWWCSAGGSHGVSCARWCAGCELDRPHAAFPTGNN